MPPPDSILDTFLHVRDDGRSDRLVVDERFWQGLAEGALPQLDRGRLLSAFTFSGPWETWERHPAGEELVMLLSGSATLRLEGREGEREVALAAPGDFVLVPTNTWHTATSHGAATLLFLTPGAGTEHRPHAH